MQHIAPIDVRVNGVEVKEVRLQRAIRSGFPSGPYSIRVELCGIPAFTLTDDCLMEVCQGEAWFRVDTPTLTEMLMVKS